MLKQLYFSKIMRAITEFSMIKPHDKIMIGLSGGKDSLFLTYSLAMLKKRLKMDFTLKAVTIDPLFTSDFSDAYIKKFCEELGIKHTTCPTDIKSIIDTSKQPACFTCSYFRRGAVNRFALENDCNIVAYAHHYDDALETFWLNLFHSGQLKTFLPSTYLSKTNLTVIRPLIYFRESEIKDAVKLYNLKPVQSPCPIDGKTMRQKSKELLKSLAADYPALYEHLGSAMRQNSIKELWPPVPNRKEIKARYDAFMQQKKEI